MDFDTGSARTKQSTGERGTRSSSYGCSRFCRLLPTVVAGQAFERSSPSQSFITSTMSMRRLANRASALTQLVARAEGSAPALSHVR